MRAARIVGEQAPSELGAVRPGIAAPSEAVQAKPRRGVRTALVWGGLGFVAGAAFWHAVGFWSFLSNVVLNDASQAHAEAARANAPAVLVSGRPQPAALPTLYLIDPANCTGLALDRATNRIAVRPCPKNGLALRLERAGGREDLARLTAPRLQAAGYRAN